MPKIVNHHSRRDAVASAAIDVIGQHGIDNVTLQDISAHAGYSTRVISHYFKNKRDMLLFTYRAALARAIQRGRAIAQKSADPLTAAIEAFLPLDEERRRWWHTWFALANMSLGDSKFAATSRRYNRRGEKLFRSLLAEERAAGRFSPDLDIDLAAAKMVAFVNGLASMAIADPARWTNNRLRVLLASEITGIRSKV